MHHQHRHGDHLEVFIIFEPRVDSRVVSDSCRHALALPVRDHRRRLGPVQVVTVVTDLQERNVEELRPVAQHACPDRFEPLAVDRTGCLLRYMFGVSEATSTAFATSSWWRAT